MCSTNSLVSARERLHIDQIALDAVELSLHQSLMLQNPKGVVKRRKVEGHQEIDSDRSPGHWLTSALSRPVATICLNHYYLTFHKPWLSLKRNPSICSVSQTRIINRSFYIGPQIRSRLWEKKWSDLVVKKRIWIVIFRSLILDRQQSPVSSLTWHDDRDRHCYRKHRSKIKLIQVLKISDSKAALSICHELLHATLLPLSFSECTANPGHERCHIYHFFLLTLCLIYRKESFNRFWERRTAILLVLQKNGESEKAFALIFRS